MIPSSMFSLAGKQEAIKKTISCISGNGRGYMGDREVTASGKDCQRWGSSRPHVHPMFEVLFPEVCPCSCGSLQLLLTVELILNHYNYHQIATSLCGLYKENPV
jgi:hypothetical protein